MQRTAEIDDKVIFGFDMARPDSDYTVLVARIGARIVETFAVPPELLRQRDGGSNNQERIIQLQAFVARMQWVWHLRHRAHVSEAIIERVLRLNPEINEHSRMRGLRRTSHEFDAFLRGVMGKGEFIREYGRANFEALPNHLLYKRGRRRWVPHNVIRERAWEYWQGRRQCDMLFVADGPGFYGDNLKLRAIPWAEFAARMGFAKGD